MDKLKATYLKLRPKLIIFFSLIMIGIALLNLYYVFEVRVTSNDECLWVPKKISQDSVKIYFDVVKENGVTWNAGIRNGDQLLEINGTHLYGTYQAQMILNEVHGGNFAEYVVKKPDGKIVTTKVYVKKLIQFGSLAGALSALFWFLIGFIVLMAKPDGRVHKLFYAIGVLAVFSAMEILIPKDAAIYTQIQSNGILMLLLLVIWAIGVSFVGPAVLYFFWNFPNPFKFAQKKWVKRLFIIFPTILALVLITVGLQAFSTKVIPMHVFVSLISAVGTFIAIVNVVAIISLIIQYRKIKKRESKKPLMLIIIALSFGIALTIYISQIAPAISGLIFNSPEYYAPIVLIALVPLVVAYAIFKYQLMDVSVVVRNTIIYGAATLTVAAIYFLIIYVAGHQLSKIVGAKNQGIIAGIFFVIFALIFQSTKNKFQDFLTKQFYPEQFAHQKVLINLSNELATVVGLENILDKMEKTFVDALKINKFGILIGDKDGVLRLTKSVGIKNKDCTITESRIAPFLKRKMLTTKYPAIERNDFKKVFPDEKAETLLEEEIYTIIPMIVKSKIVGLLLFGLKHSGSQFASKDIELLWAAANQAAVSIENARLYESEAEKLKLERDLNLARKIQEGLLPTKIPQIKNLDISGEMIPAMQVGGDYFDLLPVNGSNSKLYVIIGDVSGKGLGASLYMTKLQTMVKFSCTADKSPREILIEINKRMYGEIERNTFVTMSVAYFDLDENTVKFCRAGHMPVLTATNGTVESYRTQGIGVGLEKGEIFDSTLVEEELKLTQGQIFAFFTDGITEAMNEKQEFFGEENLSSLIKNKSSHRSTELMDEIWQSVNAFRGSAEVNDDMTMVIVKVD